LAHKSIAASAFLTPRGHRRSISIRVPSPERAESYARFSLMFPAAILLLIYIPVVSPMPQSVPIPRDDRVAAFSCTFMPTLWLEALESLVDFCVLFPDMAIDMNNIPATTQNVSLPLPSSARRGLERGPLCEGRSSTKRTASTPASDGDHRSLFDLHIFEARLLVA
jgi:hypothetical protein